MGERGRSRSRRRARSGVVGSLLVLVLVGGGGADALAGPDRAAQDADGLRFEHHVTYDVDPVAQAVHVVHDATLTNEAPDEAIAGGTRFTYFPEAVFPVPAGVTAVRASRVGGGPLAARVEATPSPVVSLIVVDLSPDLRYRQTQQVQVAYDLPAVAPRSDSVFRVNSAFVSFPILLLGDAGLTTVSVRVPEAFDVSVVGDAMDQRSEGTTTILEAAPDDPIAWFTTVLARNDDALLSEEIDVGEHGAVVRAWPNDPDWAAFAARQVREGVPALEAMLGLPWPATRPIDVLETAAPYLYGYAGWYQPNEGLIEVGDELDQQVVLHELAHLWFNTDLFEGRWINEALAEVFAAAAGAELGGTPPEPQPIDPAAPGAVKLNDWDTPDLESDTSAEREAYGYNTAWAVLDGVADEVGLDAMAEVVQAADAGRAAYGGPGMPEELGRTFDWRELLDLLEEQAGSATAADLFAAHVVGETDAAEFAARRASRERYDALVEASDGWHAPLAVRLALADWEFAEADDHMADSEALLADRDDVLADLAGLDVDTTVLRDTYERGRDLGAVADEVDDAVEAADELRQADEAADRSVGPLGAVGLLLSSPDDEVDAAVSAFEEGRYTSATSHAESAQDLVDGASTAGLVRIAVVLAVIAAALVFRWLWKRTGTDRAPTGAPEETGDAGADASAATGPER